MEATDDGVALDTALATFVMLLGVEKDITRSRKDGRGPNSPCQALGCHEMRRKLSEVEVQQKECQKAGYATEQGGVNHGVGV